MPESRAASKAVRASAPGPTRYGRYVLIDRLGAGGMAEVFRALVLGPEGFQRMIVVKRILPHLSQDEDFVRMFISEASLCGRLSHPNIIQIHEFGNADGQYFIAMEYLQGRTVTSLMARLLTRAERAPVPISCEIARQACLGLAYAHGLASVDSKPLGIVHRDVTPSNVMIAYTGAVKVLDFGIARVAGEVRADTTDPGQIKGKSSYLSPEQLNPRQPIDSRADIFSLGIILHELLTGRRLFKGAGPLETMRMITDMPIAPPSRINPAVPAEIDRIALRALARKREDRYQDAASMAADLEAYLIGQRFTSQELPAFLRGLFKEELSHDLAMPKTDEITALLANDPAPTGSRQPVARELVPPVIEPRRADTLRELAVPQSMPEAPSLAVELVEPEDQEKTADTQIWLSPRRKKTLLAQGVTAMLLLGFGAMLLVLTTWRRTPPAARPVMAHPAPALPSPPAASAPQETPAPPVPSPPPVTAPPVSRPARIVNTIKAALHRFSRWQKSAPVAPRPQPQKHGELTQPAPTNPTSQSTSFEGKVRNAVPIDPY